MEDDLDYSQQSSCLSFVTVEALKPTKFFKKRKDVALDFELNPEATKTKHVIGSLYQQDEADEKKSLNESLL